MNKYLSALLIILLCTAAAYAGEKDGSKTRRFAKTTDVQYDFISINSILMHLSNNGDMAYNSATGASGLEWPQGSGKNSIYEDGLVWGGYLSGQLRVGGSTYRHGLQPGTIDTSSGLAANPKEKLSTGRPRFRIYKFRKFDAATYEALEAKFKTRFKDDYTEWPIGDGAPFTNRDGVAGYQPDFDKWLAEQSQSDVSKRRIDEPFMIGDEVLWFVSNDKDAALTTNLYGTQPIGMEVQTLVWGYSSTGPLGNMVFVKYTFVNRGTDDLTNAYVAKWSDPDLGDANDDFVGVDSLKSLGYVYNGVAKDPVYGIPPAAGYDFFQGPIVPAAATDSAIFNFGKIGGFKNLPVSSFAFYINSSGVYKDPEMGAAAGATEMYNYMQGLLWNGGPFIDPTTGLQTKITLAGDPISKKGWVDGLVSSPGDRRILMTAGPFNLQKGKKQEIVVATIVGRGSDRLSSLQVLHYYDKFAQIAFDNNFDLPKAPPSPAVTAGVTNNKIVLAWGGQSSADASENWIDRGYAFEGYNVYQFRHPSDPLSSAKRLATFDVVNNIATIFDEVIDPNSGAVVTLPVQFGTDSDLQRQLEVAFDAISDLPLVNNQPYYFAVTAYSYNPAEDAAPHVLESSPKVITVRPQGLNPGDRSELKFQQMITARHSAGVGAGKPVIQVIDQTKLTGHNYKVTFDAIGTVGIPYDMDGDGNNDTTLVFDNFAWNLIDVNTGAKLITRSTNYSGPDNGYNVDGFKISMTGVPYWVPGHEISEQVWTPGTNPYTGYAAGIGTSDPFILGGHFLGSSLYDWESMRSVELRFDRTKPSKGYAYLRGGTPNYGYQGYFDSPIQVWNVADPNNPKQISYAFAEQNASPFKNNEWMWGNAASDREYMFIIDEPYSDTPNPAYTGAFRINAGAPTVPIIFATWGYAKSPVADPKAYPWKDGSKLLIQANTPFSTADVFDFSTKAKVFSKEDAVNDVQAMNVFPNPYFGANAQELNKYQRWVTFNHVPKEATLRIFTVSGTLVKTIKTDPSKDVQIIDWDLRNDNGLPVGSGMYLVYVDMPGIGTTKVLKLAIIMEAQFLDRI